MLFIREAVARLKYSSRWSRCSSFSREQHKRQIDPAIDCREGNKVRINFPLATRTNAKRLTSDDSPLPTTLLIPVPNATRSRDTIRIGIQSRLNGYYCLFRAPRKIVPTLGFYSCSYSGKATYETWNLTYFHSVFYIHAAIIRM